LIHNFLKIYKQHMHLIEIANKDAKQDRKPIYILHWLKNIDHIMELCKIYCDIKLLVLSCYSQL